MIYECKNKWEKFLIYHKAMKKGLYLFILDKLFKREMVRMISIDGINIYIRTNTSDIYVAISSLFEKEYDYIRADNPKFIIDAGANIGTSSIFFAEKYPDARIIAMEPEESNFDLLLRNTRNYENIIAIKAAIWGASEKRTIKNQFSGHWGYTISDTLKRSESTGQNINCTTIGNIMEKYGIEKIDILKMDIEGSEKNVLENSSNWIDSVEILTVELHDRICMGCARAFYLATKDFTIFEKHAEKVTAYKH
ncbi:MAG: FkbM family methyltransferase [Spirochaetes bacterium]|nr:FkbM family methyltransferase [Spirochaetota bacterium]